MTNFVLSSPGRRRNKAIYQTRFLFSKQETVDLFLFLNEKNQNQKVGVDNQVKHLLARRLHKSSLIRFGWQQQEIQLKPKREEENVDKRKQATTARELDGLLVSRSCQER